MSVTANFIPDSKAGPYTCLEHYLKIEDSKGEELFLKFFETEQELQRAFKEMTISKAGFGSISPLIFPVRYDHPTQFFQSLFTPHALIAFSSLEHRIAKIVAEFFVLLLDMATLPVRALTAIPYVLYMHFLSAEKEHKILGLIRHNALASDALSEGKVVVRAITENFSEIQPGFINGKRIFKLDGTVSGKMSEVYIKRPFYAGKTCSSEEDRGPTGFFTEGIQAHYYALQHLSREHEYTFK